MSTHTTGPWHFDERQAGTGDTGSVEALTPDRKLVTREICTVLFDDDDPREDAANARLIAAAPDLLAACENADRLLNNLMKAVPWGQTFDLDMALLNKVLIDLPAAIHKATAEQQ